MTAIMPPIPETPSMAMTTSTARTELSRLRAAFSFGLRPKLWRFWLGTACALLTLLASAASMKATTVFGPWVPMFKGIDYGMGTNTPGGGGFAELQVVNALRVDLTDPDLQFFSTPRYSNYVSDAGSICGKETAAFTTTNFLKMYGLQIAVNANNFHDPCTVDSPSY